MTEFIDDLFSTIDEIYAVIYSYFFHFFEIISKNINGAISSK